MEESTALSESLTGEDSDVDNEGSTLNVSTAQLVELMSYAMKKRKHPNPVAPSCGKRRKTSETLESLESTSYAISRLGNTDNQQKLVKRNEYLEKRVKQLEKLNFELQYGLSHMITETITKAIADTGIANPISTTPTIERRPIFNGNEAFIFNDVTSSSRMSDDNLPQDDSVVSLPLLQPTDEYQTLQGFSRTDLISSTSITEKASDLLKNIESIAAMSPTYKKMTNRLLHYFFKREDLINSNLSGKTKGKTIRESGKCKLDEKIIQLIVDQTAEYFPGSTSGDIRMVISQICKDKSRKKKQLSEG